MNGAELCLLIIVVGGIGIIAFYFYNADRKRRKIAEARENYKNSLALLKKNPANSDLRQRTLEWGRYFARVAREGGNETLFDEVALMNDLNAVGMATTPVDAKVQQKQPAVEEKSIEDRLKALEDLKEKSLITDEEYDKKRTQILDEV